jgi:sterol desaturase/sphingolipid hydroxylase (fatty acid hydroxylase superfamily)
MLGIPLGLAWASAGEWWIHKHVLHGLGKEKKSFWSFHWHEHHRNVRREDHIDPCYERPLLGWHAQGKEALALVGLAAAHAPMLPVAPWFTLTVWWRILHYHYVHKRSHLDSEWARENLPWHYDHHMGRNQDANWCVTHPFWDEVMGTREPYCGTAEEAKDLAKRARLAAARAAAAEFGPSAEGGDVHEVRTDAATSAA